MGTKIHKALVVSAKIQLVHMQKIKQKKMNLLQSVKNTLHTLSKEK